MERYRKAYSIDVDKITSGLCPRHYTMVASIPSGGTGYLTMQAQPILYSNEHPVVGVCCPWEPYDVGDGSGTDGESGVRPYWRFGNHTFDGGHGNFTYLCHKGVDEAAVPIFVEWNQRTDPIATIYDKKEKNWQYAFYTSWPLPRTDTSDFRDKYRTYYGVIPASVSTNDPDPTNTAEATNYPKLPPKPKTPRRPLSGGEIVGTVIGCMLFVVLLVAGLVIIRSKRQRKRTAAAALAGGGDVPPAPTTAAALRASRLPVTRRVNTEEIDAPPLYSPSARDDEIPLERMAVSSDHGGISTLGSEERLVRLDTGTLADAPPYAPPTENSPFLNVPGAHEAPETPRGQAPPYTAQRD